MGTPGALRLRQGGKAIFRVYKPWEGNRDTGGVYTLNSRARWRVRERGGDGFDGTLPAPWLALRDF